MLLPLPSLPPGEKQPARLLSPPLLSRLFQPSSWPSHHHHNTSCCCCCCSHITPPPTPTNPSFFFLLLCSLFFLFLLLLVSRCSQPISPSPSPNPSLSLRLPPKCSPLSSNSTPQRAKGGVRFVPLLGRASFPSSVFDLRFPPVLLFYYLPSASGHGHRFGLPSSSTYYSTTQWVMASHRRLIKSHTHTRLPQ